MLKESLLVYAHISAILLLAVFLTSKTALMRSESIDGRKPVVDRLLRLDIWLWGSFCAVGATGLAAMVWGAKGWDWTVANPLLWIKVGLFLLMVGMSIRASLTLRQWARECRPGGHFPSDDAIRRQRRWLMWQSHAMVLLPLFGALLAYGF
ncbi:MAG: DUF2214 family protein [Betaproteobacteria bacterium]|nr:DUF2214 family protein [Betaproteobacteria bacterium]MDE2124447.1 DUF2214 family protein [Betaproteobacteria bacterium]MDE2185753.1 DUF2214 family protein [Betaproteobacteria bacterium]MDE2324836.1 DUF2214 family protein [Betaproteobacteria bacterium]